MEPNHNVRLLYHMVRAAETDPSEEYVKALNEPEEITQQEVQEEAYYSNALLPEYMLFRYIKDMEIGETRSAPIDVMRVDNELRCWIDTSLPYELEEETNCLLLTKAEEGFFVDMRNITGSLLYAEQREDSKYHKRAKSYAPVLKLSNIPEEAAYGE